ncbi:MAG: helicase-exonuclease AddAB subunit AddA [Oscillospiraceae bacterium]|nr:helicase-exonuclease AddAB subunit AddA [Oscillospiraceae bacterium]
MAETLTPQQRQAVMNSGGKLLVSAAAGSGKTKVLVDRLMRYILDPVDPANLDEFLIITYTKAAAAELRGKIAAKLSEHLAENPGNRHLQKQMQLLYLTRISTVHAFCADLLREYAYQLDLPADFRVADENECAQLRETVMSQMLDRAYETAEADHDFRAFVDAQGLGRNDKLVPEILLKVYDSAKCHLDPNGWLNCCIESVNTEGMTDISETTWGAYLIEDFRAFLLQHIETMKKCLGASEGYEDMKKLSALLADTVYQLEKLYACETWDEILLHKDISFGRIPDTKKCCDQDLAERIKVIRSACMDGVRKKVKIFADPSCQLFEDLQGTLGAVRGIVSLVRRFDEAFLKAKRSRRIMDFSDLEHKTLDLLLGKNRSTVLPVAKEIGSRFREVMVDEYQDSNAVQDAIFSTITRENRNCFMVGDVKQSIYGFRLADPSIFLDKYQSYEPAETAEPGQSRKVALSSNFRSGGGVLAGVNDVFRLCMSEKIGGLQYGKEEALYEGIPHTPLGEPEVELWTIPVEESTYPEEAEFVAGRIKELLDGEHYVRDKDKLRRIRPEDIAILLRSPGSVGGYFRSALSRKGIRCVSGGGEDLLQTPEVSTLRSILQTVSNPRQDIPLLAALASPVFGFTADDLAAFRSGKRYGRVYDSLVQSTSQKCVRFLEVLTQLRKDARLCSLTQLIEQIFLLTGMDSIYSAMDGGEMKLSNLKTFYSYAAAYEDGGRRDLEQFMEHLDAISDKGLISQNEESTVGAVTIMSIHKSKGLEFPVVFVSNLSRSFNREITRANIVCDQKLGLGLSVVDANQRVRYPTIAKRAIVAKKIADDLSEEMRVLYVALTRARDRLIMTYASQTLEKDLKEIALRMDMTNPELLTREVTCPGEWVLMTALRRTEAGELFALGGKPADTSLGTPPWLIGVSTVVGSAAGVAEEEIKGKMDENVVALLQKGLSFRYRYKAATAAPSKQTATQRKGREKDNEVSEDTPEAKQAFTAFRKPTFLDSKASATDKGNATHIAMQYLRFENCKDEMAVLSELKTLCEEGVLTKEQVEMIDSAKIAGFFATSLGRKLMAGEEVLREFKFSILDDGENYDSSLTDEKILLQGVVDCALIEEDGITVIDFKTDRVTGQTQKERVEHYRPQVMAYADALTRIYQKPVKEAYLYFFATGEADRIL